MKNATNNAATETKGATMSDYTHKFELAGLGKAPFRFVGYERKTYQACPGAPVQVGGSCDYCSTGIVDMFYVESADGKRFKVGSSCIEKCGKRGEQLTDAVKLQVRKIKRERKAERDAKRIAAARETLETVREGLAAKAHPLQWRADQGDTLADWADWMLKNAGTKGRLDVARVVENFASQN